MANEDKIKKSNLPIIKMDPVLYGFCDTMLEELPTHEVIKRLWAYIKKNNLKKPKAV